MIELSLHRTRPAKGLSKDAADFLRLLADPTRRKIFIHLMAGETCNCEMGQILGLSQNLISHHLLQLRLSGFILARHDSIDKRWVYYSVNREALARVHRELGVTFDPARVGTRVAQCGPENAER